MNRTLIPALLSAALLLAGCAAPSPSTGAPQTTAASSSGAAQTGSGVQTVSLAEYEALKAETDEAIDQLTDDISRLEAENKTLQKGSEVTPDNSAIAFRERLAGLLYFPVYELDVTMEASPAAYVAIKPQASVEEKLGELTQGIAEILFDGRSMKLVGIEDTSEGKVAVVDLVDGASWNQVFQGTSGGAAASQALILSYLQADYTNAWIDGVRFTMDGEAILLDHAPLLEETQFRE